MTRSANRPRSWILLTTWLLVIQFVSCKSESEDDKNFFWALHQQLEQSSQSLASEAKRHSKDLESKLQKPETFYRAEFWQPNLAFIEEQILGALALVDSLQETLLIAQGFNKKLNREAFLNKKMLRRL